MEFPLTMDGPAAVPGGYDADQSLSISVYGNYTFTIQTQTRNLEQTMDCLYLNRTKLNFGGL